DWELIVVDNASIDGTDQYLEDFAQSRSWVKVVINPENVGFSAGNNAGIRASDGEYIVLLNNDTYVTEGWLNKLIRPLRLNPDLGLVGPVTNAIGNEAQIPVFYDDTNEMAKVAKRYSREHDRQIFYCDNLAFFCVALRRNLFDEIGDLDEKFNIGFFEDDDYCMRVRQAGYRIGIAEDVFIHHRLSATLDTLGAIAKKKQFDRNLEIFEAKWGKWKPHSHREGSHAGV
ncbi:MAG: glycosyltransferase family 2 protein, partial [Desulfomonilaceae bacterium]